MVRVELIMGAEPVNMAVETLLCASLEYILQCVGS